MKQVHYNMTKGFLQAAAGTAAAAILFASWPGAARAAMKEADTSSAPVCALEHLPLKGKAEAAGTGMLIIPAREVPGAGREDVTRIDNERRIALKLARWEASKDAAEPEQPYTDEELELLACTIYCEAGSDTISDETRRMVGEVVLNRVAHPDYPDTIEEVLTQRGQYGRFYWTGVVWPARADRTAEAHAVERAYDCARLVFESERLLPEDVIYQAGFRQGHECVAHAPGFYFCR